MLEVPSTMWEPPAGSRRVGNHDHLWKTTLPQVLNLQYMYMYVQCSIANLLVFKEMPRYMLMQATRSLNLKVLINLNNIHSIVCA